MVALVGSVFETRLGARYLALLRETAMRRQTREGWARLGDYFDVYVWFFSEDPRTDREKAPVREFLRYLGVGFTEEELVVPLKDDDVDVRFREARFQNVERIVAARRQHEEVRQFAERVRTAREVAARGVPRGDSVPMRVRELLREVHKALGNESRKTVNRAALDALVYVNLRGRHLYPAPDVFEEDARAVADLGWRSVSVLWPPYAVVISAKSAAPKFLRVKTGQIIRHSGIAWEGAALPPEAASVAYVARSALAGLAVAGYVALGGVVLAARATRDVIDTLSARVRGSARVVEAESAMTG